jgi:hypothetical protein
MKDASKITWFISILAFALLLIGLYVSLRRWFIQENFRLERDTLEAFSAQQNAAREAQPDLPGSIRIYRCPANTKYFIDKNGNSFCCNGTVRGLKCDGDVVCTMSPSKGGVESCAAIEQRIQAGTSERVCPSSMPNYFENFTTGYKGCTSSELTASLDAPTNEAAPKCRIYATDAENNNKVDSCANIREMEKMPCISANCKKTVTSMEGDKPALVMQTYFAGESVPVPRMCSSKASYVRYLTAKGQSTGALEGNPAICEVVKALLDAGKPIDGTCSATPATVA